MSLHHGLGGMTEIDLAGHGLGALTGEFSVRPWQIRTVRLKRTLE